MRALIEEGLRLVLDAESAKVAYSLRDCSVGEKGAANPLESMSWQDLRERIYEDH